MFIVDSYRKHHAFELIQQGKAEQLLSMKLNHVINQLNDKGHSLLYEAIKYFHGDLSIIHKLLECPDVDIDLGKVTSSFTNKTPLYLACKYGHHEVVKELLKQSQIHVNKFSIMIEQEFAKGGDSEFSKMKANLQHGKKHKTEFNVVIPCAKTPLYVSIENGHFPTAELLMGRTDIDINKGYAGYLAFGSSTLTKIHGRSILFLAMKSASKHFVKMILKKQNIDTNFGIQQVTETNLFEKFPPILNDRLEKIEYKTPLRVALDDHFSMDIIEMLLENSKTNPNECDCFLDVCKSGNVELAHMFLKNSNLDVNLGCPLAYCLESMELASLFLEDPKIDLSPHDGLILKNAILLKGDKRKDMITRLLLRKDLDVNKGMVFYELCAEGNIELVKLFVTMRKDLKPDLMGPVIKHTGSEGFLNVEAHKQAVNFQFRPIEIAYINNHEDLAQYLIENTQVKPLDITKLLFEDKKEPGSFYKLNSNGKRELSSGVYALWVDDDEDKYSVYSSGKYSDF